MERNLHTMQSVGASGSAVALIFFVIAPIIIPSWSVTVEYISVLPVLLLTFVFANMCLHTKRKPSPVIVEVASAVFYALLQSVFIAISVFPYPDTPQIFVSLCFMFMPSLIILRPSVLVSLMLASEAVFVSLAVMNKSPFSIENDIFNTVASLFFSFILMMLTNNLRYRNFEMRMKLQRLSRTDSLTGLLNKKAFEESCEFFLNSRSPDARCAFLVIDLDDFKCVNNKYGHPYGDLLLAAFGGAIEKALGNTDITGRIGGDEFAVLIRDAGDDDKVKEKLSDLSRRFDALSIEGTPHSAACSIGVAFSTEHGESCLELFRKADSELYRIKREKKAFRN